MSNNIHNRQGKQNTKHKYIRDVQIGYIIQKGIGCEISQNTHGGLSTINVNMSLTSLRQHNKIISRGRLKKTKMIIKLFLILPIAYYLGNKNHPYQIQPPYQY